MFRHKLCYWKENILPIYVLELDGIYGCRNEYVAPALQGNTASLWEKLHHVAYQSSVPNVGLKPLYYKEEHLTERIDK